MGFLDPIPPEVLLVIEFFFVKLLASLILSFSPLFELCLLGVFWSCYSLFLFKDYINAVSRSVCLFFIIMLFGEAC
jgi:hypothetical protein